MRSIETYTNYRNFKNWSVLNLEIVIGQDSEYSYVIETPIIEFKIDQKLLIKYELW